MQYQGGKSRISKPISEVINNALSRREIKNSCSYCINNYERKKERIFISLFCGTCSVESKIKDFDRIICNDNNEYLIEMLKGVQNGYELPEFISETEYKDVRKHKDENKILTGFVGFGCSFGGKFFGGYARNEKETNYAAQSKRSLLKDMTTLTNAEFTCLDYRKVKIPHGSVVYADPPYANTTGYNGQKFNSDVFWEYMRKIAQHSQVFISEQTAPDDFVCVWEKPFRRTLDVNKENKIIVTEKLFTYKNNEV